MSRYVDPKRTALAVTNEQTTALVASAIGRSAGLNRKIRRRADARQERAWRHYDNCGELRYATNWFANALSRATLKVVRMKGDEATDVDAGPAYEALQRLIRGAGGPATLLKAMGQQYFVPGEWYLVGRMPTADEKDLVPAGEMLFEVASTSEIEKTGDDWFLLREGGEKIPLKESEPIIRMWQPHPKKKNEPDSPVLGNDAIITQIEVLTKHTAAQVFSRLAGAGLLVLPSEFSFGTPPGTPPPPDGVDPFLAMLGEVMAAAIEDPGTPEAMVPVLVKVPGEMIEKIQHLTFWSELDAQTVPQTEAGIRRLALGLDLPPEVLTGTADVNHWGAWQIDESAIKAHIEPALTIICAYLTMDYLRYFAPDEQDCYITFDTSALRLRPNRSKEAVELYDRGAIGAEALRRETGFEEQDEMKEEERKIWLLMKVASGSATPEMVADALRLLNVAFPQPVQDVPTNEARPAPSIADHPEVGPPPMEDQAAALYAMCDALVYRAMERAGNRLNNGTKARPPGADPSETHLFIKAPTNRLDALLADAWGPLPRFLERMKYHPDIIAGCLDSYCRTLLVEQRPHTVEEMQRFIRSGMSMVQ